MATLERRLDVLEKHCSTADPLVIRCTSLIGVIGEPVRIERVGSQAAWHRGPDEDASQFRDRVLIGQTADANGLIVLKEHNMQEQGSGHEH